MSVTKIFLVIALLSTVLFADMGPAPDPPKVIVHMVTEGSPETSIESITYTCKMPYGGGAMMDTPSAEFNCDGGTCANNESDWFYKLDPCFNFPRGAFSYEYGGKIIHTEIFEFSEGYQKYELTIDAPSGHIVSKLGSTIPGCCGSAFIPAIIIGALLIRKK